MMDTETLLEIASSFKLVNILEDDTQKRLNEPDGYYCPWEQGRDYSRLEIPQGIADEHRHTIRAILDFWMKKPNIYHESLSHIIFYWKMEPLYILKNSFVNPTPKNIVHVVWLDSLAKFELFQEVRKREEIGRRRWMAIAWGLLWAGTALLIEDFKRF